MQSFFTHFLSLLSPVSIQPISIERFSYDVNHFGRKSTIKSEHNPIWRNKGMPYHSFYNTVTSNPTFSSTILTICQECAAIFQWQPLATTICVRHLSQVFLTSFTNSTLTYAFLYSNGADIHCQQCHISKRLFLGDSTKAIIECECRNSLAIARHNFFFKFAHFFDAF